MLQTEINIFNGVVIAPGALPADPARFRQELADSLPLWTAEARAVVWLEIPLELASHIPVAVAAGFHFHHSGEAYLLLVRRLQPDAYVPPYATHYIGAGGVVLNDAQELLVVSERHRRDRSRPYYKLPGGALHPGEHIADAVVREVWEETGIETRFEALVCFRHWHGYRYGKSDIYFICRLAPLTHAISIHESEIEEAHWMPVAKYLSSDYVGSFNRTVVRAALDAQGVVPTSVEGFDNPAAREFFFPPR